MKSLKKLSLLFGLTMIFLLATSGLAFAAFTMPGVPQDAGFYDKPYTDYTEADCRGCHFNTAEMHHLTNTAINVGCTACHEVDANGAIATPIDRNCLNCHPSSWHHTSGVALNGQCAVCHDATLVRSAGTGLVAPEKPDYEITSVTPTPTACANCHIEFNPAWPSGNSPQLVSHHGTSTQLGSQCGFCHDFKTPPTVAAPIRMCESCHTITTLHTIAGHTVSNDRCNGCHGEYKDTLPPTYDVLPAVATVDHVYAKKYDEFVITGTGFGLTDMGTTKVYFVSKDTLGTPITTEAPISFLFDTEITAGVPNIPIGNYEVYVKTPKGESNRKLFAVINAPTITNTAPTKGVAGSKVTINGTGFNYGATTVTFANGAGSYKLNASIISATQLTVTLPANIAAGSYGVTISNNAGNSNSVTFIVGTAPKLTSLAPTSGPVGRTVIIYGTALSFGTKPTVKFGTTNANVTSYSATKVYAVVPAIPAGAVNVTVNNGYADSNALAFTVQ